MVEKFGLDEEQAFIHTGLFLAWLVNNGLMSCFFSKESGSEIEKLTTRKISPCAIYMNWDGTLIGEMLIKEGFNFSMVYFDFDKGHYIKDYEKTFDVSGEAFFTIKDTWENYDKLKLILDLEFEKWRK